MTISLGGGSGGSGGGQSQTPSGGGSSGGGQTPQPAPAQFMDGMARDALSAVNQYRASNGLPALAWNDSLYASAQVRAQELVTLFSHTRPNGESCFTAMSGFSTYAENIAMGYPTASAVADGWYNSEGHRSNMLNGSFTDAAIACWYQDGVCYWVNLFGG